tara:strand:- start:608 stop:1219 length:612 start_codon:yes stop_codon:yes gene_type:complete
MFRVIYDVFEYGLLSVLYYIMHFYTYLSTFFTPTNDQYKLIKSELYTNNLQNSPIETIYFQSNKLTFPKISDEFDIIRLYYEYNNEHYQLIINTPILEDINKYYPPYKVDELKKIDQEIKPILTATVSIKQKNEQEDEIEEDITDLINELIGPKHNFYDDLEDYIKPNIYNIWGNNVIDVTFMLEDLREIKLENDRNILEISK